MPSDQTALKPQVRKKPPERQPIKKAAVAQYSIFRKCRNSPRTIENVGSAH